MDIPRKLKSELLSFSKLPGRGGLCETSATGYQPNIIYPTRSRVALAYQRGSIVRPAPHPPPPTFSSPPPSPLVNARIPGDDCDSDIPHNPTFRPGPSFVLTSPINSCTSGDVVRINDLSNLYRHVSEPAILFFSAGVTIVFCCSLW
jgi:hypothetical protein